MENFENKDNREQEQPSLTPVRESAADITAGAGQTGQIEKMQENAKRESGDQNTQVPLPNVNNGTAPIADREALEQSIATGRGQTDKTE